MKKTLLVAVITAVGLAFVSCEAETLAHTSDSTEQLNANGSDQNTMPIVSDDGPGDDVIIIIPPKKP
ncbi:hypothetical protein [Flavobacterium sp. SM2513]|uniref:hypothetical protein n=1 Tax=Flavobacterium sp. SM2513 TaxID=3424766 RepID=UPI003D7F7A54